MLYLPMSFALIYFAVVSVAGVSLILLDRHRSKINGDRIAELWMMLLGMAGGALAMLITMAITNHKIRYKKFKIGYPIMIPFHVVFLALVARFGPTYHVQLELDIEYLLAALVAINIFAATITHVDKKNAQKGSWRVPEAWLMLFAAVGGAFGMLLTMCVIRHKTRYPKFMVGLPIMLVAQIGLLIWVLSDFCKFIIIYAF